MPSTSHAAEKPKAIEKRGREWREPWLPKGVRRCDSAPHLFQLRIHVGERGYRSKVNGKRIHGDFSVNFGIYPSEYEAGRVGKKVRGLLVRGIDIWSIMMALIAEGEVSAKITTRWVFRVEGGWGIKARSKGREVHLAGPFATTGEARRAIRTAFVG